MNQFVNWGNETPEQLEIRRKYEEDLREAAINKFILEARQTANQAATAVSGGGGGGSTIPPNQLHLTVDTIDSSSSSWNIFASEPTTYTIDWGDGTVDEFVNEEGGSMISSHSYEDVGIWNVIITFADPSLITRFDFIN